MDYVGLGTRIRKQRKTMQMTQDKLAELAGISLSFLGHIERGTRTASLDTIVRLANVMRVSTDFLLADSLTGEGDLSVVWIPNSRQRLVLNEISRYIGDNLDAWQQDSGPEVK